MCSANRTTPAYGSWWCEEEVRAVLWCGIAGDRSKLFENNGLGTNGRSGHVAWGPVVGLVLENGFATPAAERGYDRGTSSALISAASLKLCVTAMEQLLVCLPPR